MRENYTEVRTFTKKKNDIRLLYEISKNVIILIIYLNIVYC